MTRPHTRGYASTSTTQMDQPTSAHDVPQPTINNPSLNEASPQNIEEPTPQPPQNASIPSGSSQPITREEINRMIGNMMSNILSVIERRLPSSQPAPSVVPAKGRTPITPLIFRQPEKRGKYPARPSHLHRCTAYTTFPRKGQHSSPPANGTQIPLVDNLDEEDEARSFTALENLAMRHEAAVVRFLGTSLHLPVLAVRKAFIGQFAGSCTFSRAAPSLFAIGASPDESLRDFMSRFNRAYIRIRDSAEKSALSPSKLDYFELHDIRGSNWSRTLLEASHTITRPERVGRPERENLQTRLPAEKVQYIKDSTLTMDRERDPSLGSSKPHTHRSLLRLKSCNPRTLGPNHLVGANTIRSLAMGPKTRVLKQRRDAKSQANNPQTGGPLRTNARHLPDQERPEPKSRRGGNGRPGIGGANDVIINVIHGGPSNGGDGNRGKKRYARGEAMELVATDPQEAADHGDVPLVFTKGDEAQVKYPHQDTLLITAKVRHVRIRKIFVDNGARRTSSTII
ncbi:hypothetical protein Drorol1_Dr00024145, partial [Drosera rotundifolia]